MKKYFSLFFFVLLVFSSCNNTLDENQQSKNISQNNTLITKNISQLNNKTLETIITVNKTELINTSLNKEISFSWNIPKKVLDGGVPYAIRLSDDSLRLYYCGMGGIISATSDDGELFVKDEGIRIEPSKSLGQEESMVCDPTTIFFNKELIMYYKGANTNGGPHQAIHKIFSATSKDGLSFIKQGVVIDSEKTDDQGWASVPDAIVINNQVRIYYVSASTNPESIVSAISDDGLSFKKEPGLRLRGLVDPNIIKIKDKYLLFSVSLEGPGNTIKPGIYYSESDDGLSFDKAKPVLLEHDVFDPSIIKISENKYQLYFGKMNNNPDSPFDIWVMEGTIN